MRKSRLPGRTDRSPRRGARLLAALVLCGSAWATAEADVLEFVLDLPASGRVAYQVPVEIEYAGTVGIDVSWEGGRILAFRLEGPPDVRVRRSGPSPQRIEVEVGPAPGGGARTYTLHVIGLPASGGGPGRIRVQRPDSPEVIAARIAAALPPPPAPPEPEPWMVAFPAPDGAPADQTDVFRAIEAFRDQVVDEESWTLGVDACRWQEAALRYLVTQRRRLADGEPPPAIATRRYFREVADAVAAVERFRRSDDPFVTGPVPEDPSRRRAWFAVREQRTRPLEHRLDDLVARLEDGFAPELETEAWPRRFVSCVTACQRHFDDLAIRGDRDTGGARLAEAQWEPILAASRAFGALAMISASSIDESN